MTDTCPLSLVALAQRLADAAGSVIRPYYRRPLAVDDKADRSPVTQADREAELAIRTILEAERPADGIHGEEYGIKNPDAEFVWVIDPIDGTKSFITGRPLFGTLVALTHLGQPILGVIDQPIVGDRWVGAAGRPSTLNDAPVSVRACPTLALATLGTTTPDMFRGADWDSFRRLSAHCRMTVYGGDCYSYGLLSMGNYDLIVEADMKYYDYAALVPVITGAGGVITDWQGEPLGPHSNGRIIAAGDPRTHAEALALLTGS